MQELYNNGEYRITSKKGDECPPFIGSEFVAFICTITGFGVLLFYLLDSMSGSGMLGSYYIYMFIYMAIDATIFCALLLSGGCGVFLHLEKKEIFDDGSFTWFNIHTKVYVFSDDPDKDAIRVKEIVDTLIELSNERKKESDEWKRKKDEEKEKCCTRYKTVMEKVK